MSRRRLPCFASVLLALLALAAGSPAGAADPGVLWHVVHGSCVPDKRFFGVSTPCSAVNLAERWAVLKDTKGNLQYLLIPTDRITGIEDPAILAAGAPNYWQAAWAGRRFMEGKFGQAIPRADVSLAINAPLSRTQNQLHIHISCVKPEVREAVRNQWNGLTGEWSAFDIPGSGRRYKALRLDGEDLGARDPFRLLADADPVARGDMAEEGLAVIGMVGWDGKPGFVVIAERSDAAAKHYAGGETLQDHDCAVLKPAR